MQGTAKIPFVKCRVDLSSDETAFAGMRSVVRAIWPEYTLLPDSEFTFKRFTSGLSNVLYRVSMGRTHRVLVRVYGVGGEDMLDRDAEIRLQLQLAAKGLAAQFYAKYENGCCYEFLEGTPLQPATIGEHVEPVARELGKWHRTTLDEPRVAQEPSSVALIRRWFGLLPKELPVWKRSPYPRHLLLGEFERLLGRLIDSPLRFCHNDVLAYNIVLHQDRVRFIDYEYSGYSARGFDLGNHFNEYSGFELDFAKYPTREQQMRFIASYLVSFYESEAAVTEAEKTRLWREANQWALVSHFLWALWGLFQGQNSTIDFDFMSYSNTRFGLYFRHRDAFLNPEASDYKYV
jgi:ethanolamine kinase